MLSRLRPDEERYARRMARIARWDRPIEGRGQRLRAWTNMLPVSYTHLDVYKRQLHAEIARRTVALAEAIAA